MSDLNTEELLGWCDGKIEFMQDLMAQSAGYCETWDKELQAVSQIRRLIQDAEGDTKLEHDADLYERGVGHGRIMERKLQPEPDLEIAEEQWIAVIMDLYDIIQNKKQYKEGYKQGRKDEEIERGGAVKMPRGENPLWTFKPDTDIKMKPKHSYDVKLKIESWEKGKLKPDTQDAEVKE